jgi:hypothetical protein
MDPCCTSQLDATNTPSKLSTWLGSFPRCQVFLLSMQTHMAISGSTLMNGAAWGSLTGPDVHSCPQSIQTSPSIGPSYLSITPFLSSTHILTSCKQEDVTPCFKSPREATFNLQSAPEQSSFGASKGFTPSHQGIKWSYCQSPILIGALGPPRGT